MINRCFIVGLAVLAGMVAGCSSQKTNMVAVTYHNTTAHYNAYFIANQTINEIVRSIEQAQVHDYDNILNVIPPLDSMTSVTYAEQIEEVLKKASLIVQNHPNSKWVDDAYNLVGLARLYGYEYTHAIETFKWVNTNSKDDDIRHEALIHLMRTFIEYEEMNNALAVSDYLEKEDLSSTRRKELNLMRAWYYQNTEDWDNMVRYLVASTDDLKASDDKAMVYFIIGQLYQMQGFDAEAFSNYKKCLASSPVYELSFYAKLNMARVSNLENTRDIKNIRKDFKRLVKDAKNKEFVDRIYYEWGGFELRQNNLNEGIEKFNLSVQSGLNNPRQKGRSYLALGEIYYDTLRNYEMAKAYYDSTIQVLPQDFEGYDAIKSRQEVLEDFITQLDIVHTQDSLLALSEMDSVDIAALIQNQIDAEAAAAEEEAKRQERQSRQTTDNTTSLFENTGISDGAGSWYFSNPASIAIGQSEFRKLWGNRPLEDHWRRSVKTNQLIAATEEQEAGDDDEVQEGPENLDPVAEQESQFADMFNTIPFTEDAKQQSLQMVEEAMFRLGNIYYFDLRENDNAILTFEEFMDRFDPSEHSPEVMYKLYLLYADNRESDAQQMKDLLIADYPESNFAKELINPDYQKESQLANEILVRQYEEAYRQFDLANYQAADSIAAAAIHTYPDGDYVPRLELLRILVVGRTKDLFQYQFELGEFIEKYPDDQYTTYAQELLEASERYKESLIKLKDAQFKVEEATPHYFIAVYNASDAGSDKLISAIEAFNSSNFTESELKTGTLKLDNSTSLVMVDRFKDQESALFYYDLWRAQNTMASESRNFKFDTFVISQKNFEILYKTKELDTYKSFYTLHY